MGTRFIIQKTGSTVTRWAVRVYPLATKRLVAASNQEELLRRIADRVSCATLSRREILLMSTSKTNPLPVRPLPSQVVKDDEPILVAAAKAGDISAFETLVGRYERKIFRLAQNITQNKEDAEDVMQEAFLKAYEHLGEFQGNSRFYTWLVRIAVNQALMKLRKRRPNQVSLDEEVDTGEELMPREVEDWGPSPEERYKQSELGGILSSTITELDPSFRIVFQLRDIEEMSTEETAEALGLSIPAVKSRLLRARLKLRQKLNRYFRRSENS
jgi:RNA polymerase sigma-70 factor (ECF subfamily)